MFVLSSYSHEMKQKSLNQRFQRTWIGHKDGRDYYFQTKIKMKCKEKQ